MTIFIIFAILGFIYTVFIKPSTTNIPANEASQAKTTINNLFPFIDLITYYALDDGRAWTSDKVKYVKHILSDFVVSDWDKTLLKERLKLKNNKSLNHLIDEYKNSYPALEKKIAAMTCICEMLCLDGVPTIKVKEKVTYLGNNLGLSKVHIASVFYKFKHMLGEENSTNQSHEENISPPDNNGHDIAWACNTLEIPINQISPERVQQAYRVKIKEFHPDKHQSLSDSIRRLLHEKTQDLNKAKDILLGKL